MLPKALYIENPQANAFEASKSDDNNTAGIALADFPVVASFASQEGPGGGYNVTVASANSGFNKPWGLKVHSHFNAAAELLRQIERQEGTEKPRTEHWSSNIETIHTPLPPVVVLRALESLSINGETTITDEYSGTIRAKMGYPSRSEDELSERAAAAGREMTQARQAKAQAEWTQRVREAEAARDPRTSKSSGTV